MPLRFFLSYDNIIYAYNPTESTTSKSFALGNQGTFFLQNGGSCTWRPKGKKILRSLSQIVSYVFVCLLDPVSSSLAQSVMSMASSHSQHSHISTDTMSSMSGSYLAGADGEPGGDDVEGEEAQDATMESRGPLHQDGVSMDGDLVI